jgi:hypothetical protein
MCSRRFAIARQCVKKNATTAAADRRAGKTAAEQSVRPAFGESKREAAGRQNPRMRIRLRLKKKERSRKENVPYVQVL